MKHKTKKTLLFVVLMFLTGHAFGQQSIHPGIDLYIAGNSSEAVKSLSEATKQKAFESNGEIWNYLGLSYIKISDFKNARKALEKAVKLSPDNSVYHANLAYVYFLFRQTNKAQSESDKAIKLDPQNVTAYYTRGSASLWELHLEDAEKDANRLMIIDPAYPQGYLLKSNILVVRLGQRLDKGSTVKNEIGFLKQAHDFLQVGSELCKNSPGRRLIDDEFESITAFYNYFSRDVSGTINPNPNALPDPGVTPLKIISKPRPGYTDSARQANVQGTIILAVLFGSNGKVKHILLLKRLGNGLDEQALAAARRIVFEPMTKDGSAVSVVRKVEYTFSIY